MAKRSPQRRKSDVARRQTFEAKAPVKIPPEEPAARDEGPRLIPLDPRKTTPGFEHYVDLGDIALGRKKSGDQ